MKTNKKYLIFATIGVIILVTALILQISKHKIVNPEEQKDNINIREAQAQSYLTSEAPILKADDKIFGSQAAALKIFVFEDYANIYSAELADTLEKIRQENSNHVALIIRPYVLENSALSQIAAQAIECAAAEGKWKEMRALLFTNVKNNQLAADSFNSYARSLELNEENFSACLTNLQKSEKIEQSLQEARKYSVLGAPTMFINGEMILGARPYEDYVDSNGDKIEGLKTVVGRLIK
jgi:protein-disulfide isomerase